MGTKMAGLLRVFVLVNMVLNIRRAIPSPDGLRLLVAGVGDIIQAIEVTGTLGRAPAPGEQPKPLWKEIYYG
jgi:hypothetical protein